MQGSCKPTSRQLAQATDALWLFWHTERVLDAGSRTLNGVDMAPGQFSLRNLLDFLSTVVPVWTEGNFGSQGSRTFVANLIERGLLTVEPQTTPGKPSVYSMGIDTTTGKYFERDAFSRTAYEFRRAAYEQSIARKAMHISPIDAAFNR